MKYPEMRMELLDYVLGLSDLEYQKECWVAGRCPKGIKHDELDYAIHFLFDDTDLSSSPENLIGLLLRDENEVQYIGNLCRKLQDIFEKYGTEMSDKEYIDCNEWSSVVAAAKSAYEILSSHHINDGNP